MTDRRMTRSEMDQVECAADIALRTNCVTLMVPLGLVVVPDVVILEGIANGRDAGQPTVLQSADGRRVYVYAMPEVLVA